MKTGFHLNISKIESLGQQLGISSMAELCKRADINKNSITPYIKGERAPFTQVVLDISEALGVSPMELVSSGEDEVLQCVRNLLLPLLEIDTAVLMFGSRARKSNKKFSDIDLGVTGGAHKLDFDNYSLLKSKADDALDNYHLSVNLVNLDIAPLDFLINIEPDLLYICGNKSSATYFQGYLSGRKEN